jgi:protein O-mannosyl-transferase
VKSRSRDADRRPPATGRPWGPLLALAAITVAVVAVYAGTFRVPFVFDDIPSIVANPSIWRLWPIGPILLPPPEAVTVVGRPVVNLSLAVNYAIGGNQVWGYHALNLAIHLAAAWVLFGIVRRTLLLPSAPERLHVPATGLALAAALLWALHPLQTESVTYIVQRAESIMGLLYLLTLYCAIRAATGDGSRGWTAAAVAACALGMASKETMASAPLVVLLFDRTLVAGSFKEALRRRRGLYIGLAATWVVSAVLAVQSAGRGGSAGFGLGVTPWEYARTQFGYIVLYLRLCLWPQPLVLDYGTAVATSAADIVPYAAIVVLLVAGTVMAILKRSWLGLVGAWFFAILAPSSSVVPLAGQIAAEHRMYLPSVAVVVLAVILAWLGWEKLRPRLPAGSRWTTVGPILAVIVVSAALGGATFARNLDYRSRQSIWADVVAKCPDNPRAHKAYAATLVLAGDYPRALSELNAAIALSPDRELKIYAERGNVYIRLNRPDLALADFNHAIALDPDDAQAWLGRADACLHMQKPDEAMRDFAQAIALQPAMPLPLVKRGDAYKGLGKFDLAFRDYSRAIELKPDYADAYAARGDLFLRINRPEPAAADFTRAIALRPDDAESYNNRSAAYGQMGRLDEALQDVDRAIALNPGFADAYSNRAVVNFFRKQFDAAWSDVAECRRLGGRPSPAFIKMLVTASGRPDQP